MSQLHWLSTTTKIPSRAGAIALALAILVVLTAACGGERTPAPPGRQRLTVGVGPLSGGLAGMFTAEDLGLFASHGLDIDFKKFTSGPTCLSALIGGEFPLCFGIGGVNLVNAVAGGADLRGIASIVDTMSYSLMVAPNIQTVKDLAGRRMGVNQPGSAMEHALGLALRRLGLSLKDVQVASVGEQSQRLAALLAGAVDGTLISPPGALQATRAGFRTLFDFSTLGLVYPHQVVVSTGDALRDHADDMRRFLAAVTEGGRRFRTDRDLGLRVLARHMDIEDPEDLDATYAMYSRVLQDPPVVSTEGMRALLTQMVETDPRLATLNPERLLDMRLVREIAPDEREGSSPAPEAPASAPRAGR